MEIAQLCNSFENLEKFANQGFVKRFGQNFAFFTLHHQLKVFSLNSVAIRKNEWTMRNEINWNSSNQKIISQVAIWQRIAQLVKIGVR